MLFTLTDLAGTIPVLCFFTKVKNYLLNGLPMNRNNSWLVLIHCMSITSCEKLHTMESAENGSQSLHQETFTFNTKHILGGPAYQQKSSKMNIKMTSCYNADI